MAEKIATCTYDEKVLNYDLRVMEIRKGEWIENTIDTIVE